MTEGEVISPYLGDPSSVDRDLLSGLTTAAAGLVSRVYQRGGGSEETTTNRSTTTTTPGQATSAQTPSSGGGGGGTTERGPGLSLRRGVSRNGVGPATTTTTNGTETTSSSVAGGGGSNQASTESRDHQGSNHHSFLFLGLIFLLSLIILFWVYSTFPNLEPNEKQYIKLPRNIEDAKKLGDVLNRYKEKYYVNVLFATFFIYIFLQTFAIPGSIFLSILCGFLFPFWLALLLVCFCSATGASFCYGLSWLVGRRIIYKYFPAKVDAWAATVNNHRDNIFNYMIFLRVTPFLPNWFINITAPVIGVPIIPFFLGTFFGVAPPSFIAIQAGTTLNQLSSSSDALSWTSVLMMIGLGLLSLVPVLMKDSLRRRFQ